MKLAKYLLVGLVLLTACSSSAQQLSPQEHYNDRIVEHALLDTVKVFTATGHGSGWGVKYDGTHTWLMTCFHVVESATGAIDRNPMLLRYVTLGPPQMFFGVVVAYERDNDLALIKTKGRIPVFTRASRWDMQNLREREASPLTGEITEHGTEVIASGFMAEIEPALVSIGFVMVKNQRTFLGYGTSHSSGIWFGASGGPLIHRKSGKVLGMNALLMNYRSNFGWAISINAINKFLRKHGI